MSENRFRKGFQPAGTVSPEELGLPRKRARELLLAVAWRRVAGEALAARAEARRVFRGVLEVEPLEPDVRETLRTLLPELAGRIAAGYPALGVRRCRLIGTGEDAAPAPALDLAQENGPRPETPGR